MPPAQLQVPPAQASATRGLRPHRQASSPLCCSPAPPSRLLPHPTLSCSSDSRKLEPLGGGWEVPAPGQTRAPREHPPLLCREQDVVPEVTQGSAFGSRVQLEVPAPRLPRALCRWLLSPSRPAHGRCVSEPGRRQALSGGTFTSSPCGKSEQFHLSVFQMKKLRLREVQELPRGHTAGE